MKNWTKKTLGKIATISRGGSPRPIQSYITSDPGGYNWLRIGDVDVGGRYIFSTEEKIKLEGAKSSTIVHEGDFILSNSMSFGRPYIMKTTACIHDGWLAIKDIEQSTDNDFLYYLLTSDRVQNIFKSLAAGSGVQNLKKETVAGISLLFPTLAEQQRIVSLLQTWDEYLQHLDNKIKLKKKTKDGMLHDLMSRKLRLSKFHKEWQVVKLKDCLKIRHGKDQKKVEKVNGRYPILATGGKIGLTDTYIYNKPSVLIGRKGTIDKPKYIDTPFWTVDTLFYSEILEKNHPKFLYYCFLMINWKKYNEGSGIPSLSASTISSIKIKKPESFEEQTVIADLLTTADQELEVLQKAHALITQQRTYLLNKLVSGELRLPEFKDSDAR